VSYPVLWHFPISHYNEKVRWALDYKGIPHVRKALSLSYVPRAWWATGHAKLPVLILDGKAIGDSTRIIAALEQVRPEPSLYPHDEAARRRALEIEDHFDEEVGPAIRAATIGPLFDDDPKAAIAVLTTGMPASARRAIRVILPAFRAFYKWRHQISSEKRESDRARVVAGLERIAAELQPSGYLVGDRFSVADLAAAALFAPLVLPAEFPYPPPTPHPHAVVELRNSLAERTGLKWVVEMYRRHRGRSAEVSA